MRIDFHNLLLIMIGFLSGMIFPEPWGTISGIMMIGIFTQGRIITHGIDLYRKDSVKLYIIQNEVLILISCVALIIWKI